jgi:type II secretory pathway pseudopilin PulG
MASKLTTSKMINDQRSKINTGFTLIELMTSVSIFIVIMTISMGSIIGIFEANRKSRALKTVLINLNLAVESMSREMRYGTNYHCGSGTVTVPQNCPGGNTLISFLSSDNAQVTYRLSGTTIERKVDSGDFIPVTAPEISVDNLTFYTLGALAGDTFQPKVIVRIKSHAGSDEGRTDFTLQTLISQRSLDI